MAEWKTDTEEVKKVVEKCREFKRSLQEERCLDFIKDLDSYALKIIVERRKIEMQLEKAIGKLNAAKRNEDDARFVLRGLQAASALSWFFSPIVKGIGAAAIAAAEAVLKFMKEDTEKCKRNVELLERMLEIYSTQAKASVDLVNQAWESIKKRLHFYTDKHQEFIKRLNQASDAIDNEYNFPTPGVLMEYDFERPKIVYNPKKSVFDERLKDLRENFASLYADLCADLKDKIHHNALSNEDLERIASSKEQEFEKSLENLTPSFRDKTNALSNEELESKNLKRV